MIRCWNRLICRPDKIGTMLEEKPDRHSNIMHDFRDHSRENDILIGYFSQGLLAFSIWWYGFKEKEVAR